jgi:hypothetical protein
MMFFKVYFSEEKFRRDAEAFNQKQTGRAFCSCTPDEQYISPIEARKQIWQANSDFAINNIGEVLGALKTAREELLVLDTWDKYKKLRIDSKLKTVKDFLEQLVWKPVKRKEDK